MISDDYWWLMMVDNDESIICLVVDLSLWKIWKSLGMMKFQIYGKMKNVPNHQPVIWFGLIEYHFTWSSMIFHHQDVGISLTKLFVAHRGCHLRMGQNPVPLVNIPKMNKIIFVGMFTYPILMAIGINPWPTFWIWPEIREPLDFYGDLAMRILHQEHPIESPWQPQNRSGWANENMVYHRGLQTCFRALSNKPIESRKSMTKPGIGPEWTSWNGEFSGDIKQQVRWSEKKIAKSIFHSRQLL